MASQITRMKEEGILLLGASERPCPVWWLSGGEWDAYIVSIEERRTGGRRQADKIFL
jgi:hypothetical protein